MRTEFLGLVSSRVGPIESCVLRLKPGLTVLYGQNGSGKSSVLEQVASCLSGNSDSMAALLRLEYPEEIHDYPQWLRDFLAYWATYEERVEDMDGRIDDLLVRGPELIARALLNSLDAASEILSEIDERVTYGGLEFSLRDLANEIQGQQTYCSSPLSFAVQASWRTPLTAAVLDNEVSDARKLEFLIDPTGGEFHAWREAETAERELFAIVDSPVPPRRIRVADVVYESSKARTTFSERTQSPPGLSGVPGERNGVSEIEANEREHEEAVLRLAVSLLSDVLMDPPELFLHWGSPDSWRHGDRPRWMVRNRVSRNSNFPYYWGSDLELDRLSEAEGRWVRIAEGVAREVEGRSLRKGSQFEGEDQPPVSQLFIIIDEPEAHLHRSAESHMARGLHGWAQRLGAYVVVASHSPEMLDDPRSQLLNVVRDTEPTGASRIRPLEKPTIETMDSLGLSASDLLKRQRAFILVEGAHDEIVLRTLIGGVLDQCRVDILPLRGGKNLPDVVDSQFLFLYSSAQVIVMLDNLRMPDIVGAWHLAQSELPRDPARAGELLRDRLKRGSAEARWMSEFLSRALDGNVSDRVIPFGLSAADIIEYLPVKHFVRSAKSWEELRQKHADSKTQMNFKGWLVKQYRADFSGESLREGALSLDTLPPEFDELKEICLGLKN